MRSLIVTIALLALIDTSAAIAQTVGSRNLSAPPASANVDKQSLPEAPVGHRQPRADQVPSEQNLMGDPNDPINRENAALDRMVKGICRGC
jgi:hypothetical protein